MHEKEMETEGERERERVREKERERGPGKKKKTMERKKKSRIATNYCQALWFVCRRKTNLDRTKPNSALITNSRLTE